MNKSLRVLTAGGVTFVVGFLVGLGGTILGMTRLFNTLAQSPETPSSQQLAENIVDGTRMAFLATSIGAGISAIGLCLFIGGLIAYLAGRRRTDGIEKPMTPQTVPGSRSGGAL